MKYDLKKENDSLIVAVEGELDVRTSPDFERALMPELNNIKNVIFDMKGLTYLSSAGLRVLLAAAKVMNGPKKMTLKNVNEDVREILVITGFINLFNVE
ncbi:MAG: STAS domain-containing protein [Lachnospiraceae bacterium]|nr:STAS domain-containing protein [Lachnospiraceae bacterium]